MKMTLSLRISTAMATMISASAPWLESHGLGGVQRRTVLNRTLRGDYDSPYKARS